MFSILSFLFGCDMNQIHPSDLSSSHSLKFTGCTCVLHKLKMQTSMSLTASTRSHYVLTPIYFIPQVSSSDIEENVN